MVDIQLDLKTHLQYVDCENFSEKVIAIVHWLLTKSLKCELQDTARFPNAAWRKQLQTTQSCALKYNIQRHNGESESSNNSTLDLRYTTYDDSNVSINAVLLNNHHQMINSAPLFFHMRRLSVESNDALAARLNDQVVEPCKSLSLGYESMLLRILSHPQMGDKLVSYLDNYKTLCRLASSCSLANYVASRDAIWKKLLARDFGAFILERATRPYKEYYVKLYKQQKEEMDALSASKRHIVEPIHSHRLIDYPDHWRDAPLVPGIIQDPPPFTPLMPLLREPDIFPNHPSRNPRQPDNPLLIEQPRRRIIGDPNNYPFGELPRRGDGNRRFPHPDLEGGSGFGEFDGFI